jgi:hypothetical protein
MFPASSPSPLPSTEDSPASPASDVACGKRTRSTRHSQRKPAISFSSQQNWLESFSSISG